MQSITDGHVTYINYYLAVYIIIKVMSPLNEYFIIEYDKRLCIYDNWSTL